MIIDAVKMQIHMDIKGFTFKALAHRAGVSRQTLSCINAGKSCTPIIACKIAKALEVDIKEILKNN